MCLVRYALRLVMGAYDSNDIVKQDGRTIGLVVVLQSTDSCDDPTNSTSGVRANQERVINDGIGLIGQKSYVNRCDTDWC